MLPVQLSIHQRLVQRIQAIVPGRELENRRGRGELVVLTRITDSDGRHWQTGIRLNLINVQAGVKSQELTFTVAAFVQPGDYHLFIALCDTKTMEHSFIRRTLRVAPLKPDPLPEAWLGLPPVEFLPAVESPDSWFLPDVKGLLHLPVESKQPARVDLLVNVTPSERSNAPASSLRRSMASVIPAMKILSGLKTPVQPPGVAVVDLARHRITFDVANAATLDWTVLGKALTASNPAVIDVKSLAGQRSMREYFADEVARRAGPPGPPRWLIVMSGSLFFSKQEETPLPELPPDPNRHIIYMHFTSGFGSSGFGAFGFGGSANGGGRPGRGAPSLPGLGPDPGAQIAPAERIRGPEPGRGPAGGGQGRGRGGPGGAPFPDDLEHVLKSMGARVINVTTPEQFRKDLASLIAEISAN